MKTFKFDPQTQEWKSYSKIEEFNQVPSSFLSIDKLTREFGLKIGTFNVLFDLVPFFLQSILRAKERHIHTIELLKRENFDIIILNEVTGRFLNLIENDEFFKSEYYFSDIMERDGDVKSELTVNKSIGKRMGNLVLSKFAPDFTEMEGINKSRAFIYSSFTPVDGNGRRIEEERIGIVATHTSAFTHNDQVRKQELTRLVNSELLKNVKNVVVLGDLNLHEEHEDRTIEAINCRDLWTETRSNGLFRGYTFDSLNNSLIQMLFLNFEKRRMRLDRIITTIYSALTISVLKPH
ncbi:predicted protein [Naegleria gruberi]|uniref:Predicted protein n=1 Tax=Naegleria gruberi TaxID=5762 RepID=D2V9V6_NAEGR|nr:uncharacterized protein NAEGRDRAFT_65643 [Naegleria gruberi]EFC46207.1 predicted protein [Naegleria gruberi]|eukprot:XP_002678951.1 predicted protein [Naegleria gruberi strain NEG-M]